jgi:phenylalanyl-tRNA synthetase beta chain
MIVSWNWLKDYLDLNLDPAEVARRLAMAGLNHEGSESVGADLAIDIEVTSNRGDCLGHLGIAREIAVLHDLTLNIPTPRLPPSSSSPSVTVAIDSPDLCSRYTAQVIRGVKLGPSPAWMVERLATLGVKPVNNVVDITNYVLFECGQPLHAFDFTRLTTHGSQGERRILVREARAGEVIVAIDHKSYNLTPGMCVITDGEKPVALAGIMGGWETEVSEKTTDLLIESAEFQPLAIRNAARQLKLHSPSSYRFERGVDPEGVQWASRRCCELILELAGGEQEGPLVEAVAPRPERSAITLRLGQLPRVLGIDVPENEVRRILAALGCSELQAEPQQIQVAPPSWRRDLTREIDLIEEVARIHGYEQIPEDVAVPMTPSHRSDEERLVSKVRSALTAVGFDEALTISAVSEEWSQAFSPWTDQESLQCSVPVIKGADRLRRSLVPSLLAARGTNEALGNLDAELFEVAKIYLPKPSELPEEQWSLALVSGRDFYAVKGIIESLLDWLQAPVSLEARECSIPLFADQPAAELLLNGRRLGFLGEVSASNGKGWGLRGRCLVAELRLATLQSHAQLVPQYRSLVSFPAMEQDVNIIVQESVLWAQLEQVVRESAGELLEQVAYRETYRNPQVDGPETKRILLSMTLRGSTGTLTSDEANEVRDRVVCALSNQLGGRLLG